jgi:ATP-binding cassette subfamily C protein
MKTTSTPNADSAVAEKGAGMGPGVEGLVQASGNAGSTWRTALRLVRFSVAVDPRAFALTVATALAGSLTEGVGLVLLLPLLSAAGMNFSGVSVASRLSGASQRLLMGAGVPHGLWLPAVLGVFLATGALRSMLRRSQSMLVFTTTTRVHLALSRRVYESVVRAQWGFLVRQRAGRLTHLLTGELRNVEDAISLSLSLINLGCLTLLYLAIALKLSAAMTGLVLAMGGGLMLLERRSLGRMRASGEDFSQSVGEVYAATGEHLGNLKSVKTYDAEERDVRQFARLCGEMARHAVGAAKQQAAASFRFEVGTLAALGAVIFLALGVLHVQAATMLMLLAIFTRLMPQLASVQSEAHQLAGVLPSFDHVLAIEAECVAHAEPQTEGDGAEELAAAARLSLEREFRLEDVWFAYQASDSLRGPETSSKEPEFVLRGIDLGIEAGLLTAVVGPSGAGKSTIADLVNGLLQPTRGRLLLDGRELAAGELRQWRRQVGYVGQETVLFHRSVRENLLWAKPEASEDELREAFETASAGFVYELPGAAGRGGLETIVGDRGVLLSSGERQRISLARALLRKPTLLILDEATNALDVENEARILDAIREAMRSSKQVAVRDSNQDAKLEEKQEGRGALTVLMIAHRASAVRRADRIFELEDGRVVRSGTWDELNGETQR